MPEKRAIVIGATSGIGWDVAKLLVQRGYRVGVAGRRVEKLEEFRQQVSAQAVMKRIDVSQPEEATALLQELITELGGLDLIVISSGIGIYNPELEWQIEEAMIKVNVSGFVAMAITAFRYFQQQGYGQIAGLSSIAALRGGIVPAYGASKAFVSNYLEALRVRARRLKLPIYVTDILPGYIDTPMTRGQQHMFWVASAELAARYIVDAIEHKKRRAYITPRWTLIAWLLKLLPDWLYERIAAQGET